MTATVTETPRKRGRKRRGDRSFEIVVPELIFQRLLDLERETGRHRASIAADLVIKALIG